MSVRPCPSRQALIAALVAASLAAPPAAAQEPAADPPAADEPVAEVPVESRPTPAEPARSEPERPAGGPRLAIAPLLLKDVEDALLIQQLEQDLRDGMKRGRIELLGADEVARVAGGACTDAACIQRLRGELGATFVLRAAVSVSDRDYTLKLELIDTRNRETAAESERVCELCGLAELRALTADQAARLLARLEALAKPPPVLELTSQPAGALVLIDGQLVGRTPLERNLLEGEHVVRVMSEGYVAEEREVVAVAGVRETVQIALRRTPETLKLRKAGWGMLAAGLPVALAGLALLTLDGRPFPGSCDERDLVPAERCRQLFDTDWGGAGLAAAGTLLGTAGVMLLLRTRDRPARENKLRASIGPTYLGLSGAF